MMVGRLLSFWDGIFSGAILNFQGVACSFLWSIKQKDVFPVFCQANQWKRLGVCLFPVPECKFILILDIVQLLWLRWLILFGSVCVCSRRFPWLSTSVKDVHFSETMWLGVCQNYSVFFYNDTRACATWFVVSESFKWTTTTTTTTTTTKTTTNQQQQTNNK